MANGRAVSGAGGAPDFARAGRLSKGGLSIIALPATFGGGKGSRIKPVLGADALVSLPRTDVDIVVTEEGVADLRGRSVHERAEVLIGIAAPGLRPDLTSAWREIAARL
jgi:acyl-CoA hydrolase